MSGLLALSVLLVALTEDTFCVPVKHGFGPSTVYHRFLSNANQEARHSPSAPGAMRPNVAPSPGVSRPSSKLQPPVAAVTVCFLLLSLVPAVEAYDSGDAIALLLGTVLTVVGFCACLGWYARRRNEL